MISTNGHRTPPLVNPRPPFLRESQISVLDDPKKFLRAAREKIMEILDFPLENPKNFLRASRENRLLGDFKGQIDTSGSFLCLSWGHFWRFLRANTAKIFRALRAQSNTDFKG